MDELLEEFPVVITVPILWIEVRKAGRGGRINA